MTTEEEIAALRVRLMQSEACLAELQLEKAKADEQNAVLQNQISTLQMQSSAEMEIRALITENSPLAIYILDVADDFRYIYANPATCALFHLSRTQILGRTDTELFGPKVGQICREHIEQAVASQRPLSVDEEIVDAAGETHAVTCILGYCHAATGRELLVGFCLDHTVDAENRLQIQELNRTQNQLIARLRDERDRALAAEKARSFFFSTVSHDIRTPLNAIIGFSEMLKLGVEDPAERKRFLDSILVSGKTLLQLINDVLDLSKLEAGKMEIHPEPTDCGKLVAEIADSFRASTINKLVEIRTTIKTPMPFLMLDPQRIRQILFNLVGNAIKFTTQGYVAVTAQFLKENSSFVITVEDTGCGIPEDEQERISLPYVQAGGTGRHGGTGLGLAICKELVSCMGGKIKFASTVGKGTIFQVELVNVEIAKEATLKTLSSTQIIRLAVAGPVPTTKRILIVDDSAVNLSVLKAMLKRMGIQNIMTANNGREALDVLGTQPVDLVLTDMWMPVMDGPTLVRTLRADPRFVKLPVYAVTADVETQKTGAAIGLTGILLKPLTLEKLRTLFS